MHRELPPALKGAQVFPHLTTQAELSPPALMAPCHPLALREDATTFQWKQTSPNLIILYFNTLFLSKPLQLLVIMLFVFDLVSPSRAWLHL